MLAYFSLWIFSAAIAVVIAGPIIPRETIAHDAVVGFPQTVPDNDMGKIYLAFQPTLQIANGCASFPAVDAEGNAGGGLHTSGWTNGDCEKSKGQAYARGTEFNGKIAVMYAWYMPKDQIYAFNTMGHRHDFEGVIVWLKDLKTLTRDNVLSVCVSVHGNWRCSTEEVQYEGTSPLILYQSTGFNHAMLLNDGAWLPGAKQPVIAWEEIPPVARNTLTFHDWGAANAPLTDWHFMSNLAHCRQ